MALSWCFLGVVRSVEFRRGELLVESVVVSELWSGSAVEVVKRRMEGGVFKGNNYAGSRTAII